MSKMVFEWCYCKAHIIWPCLCRQQYTLYVLCDCDTKDLPKAQARGHLQGAGAVDPQLDHKLVKAVSVLLLLLLFLSPCHLLIDQSQSDRYDLLTFATSWSWKKIDFVYLDVEFSVVVMWHISISCSQMKCFSHWKLCVHMIRINFL